MQSIGHVLLILLLSACSAQQAPTIKVAAASNTRPALAEIVAAFEADTGTGVSVTYGSTGKLTTQILNGAPFAVFLAADQAGPARLDAAGRVAQRGPQSYAVGQLVLWHPGRPSGTDLLGPLTDPGTRHIAIANPDLAPYGRAAMDVLDRLELADAVSDKLVSGENIGQVFALVATGNAQAGFIARSQLGRTEGGWTPVPRDLHAPILQDAVRIEGQGNAEAADAFLAFLQSDRAKGILAAHGYAAP